MYKIKVKPFPIHFTSTAWLRPEQSSYVGQKQAGFYIFFQIYILLVYAILFLLCTHSKFKRVERYLFFH